ncbi:unnamed protein product [Eruca vesicaria subsp. sativa]|uniref:Phorbol-ester/DAG-type domain-containing protein n=1 Tax=Eruca vesicaria subsp. sativa TaxID=29727 RepID=A0ABC8LH48_ERUVS|nr:unnamed protein product [Eruca vesicaria subsp. sativa]
MVKLKHGAHECVLTSPEIIANGICNICFKDDPTEFSCDLCNFDLCRPCSKLPLKVSHGFHPQHPLEFCLGNREGNKRYKLCSGCGDLFSDQSLYYKCKDCEIFLDLGCAILNNIETSWNAEEKLHYSHAHLLKRCKPGPNARGTSSCLMCELPLTPSAISYGCFQCLLFVHERCIDELPREIQHPVHQAHPLTRLDFTHTCGGGKVCDACGVHIDGAPLSCLKCNFHLHMRCADSLLRGLVNKFHRHKLFYIATYAEISFVKRCGVCMRDDGGYGDGHTYHCVECGWKSHFECLGIPKSVVKKSYHIHPLVRQIFDSDDEFCGVCETMVHAGRYAYCCLECGFVSHIECILHEEVPSPLYLKDLYSHGEKLITMPRADDDDECETKELENKLVVIDIRHNHVLSSCNVTASLIECTICSRNIHGRLWECECDDETCDFKAHDNCVKLRQQSRYRFHLNHPLTLLPSYPAGTIKMRCNICEEKIDSFNLFCRICEFTICTKCAVSVKMRLGELQRGQKFIRYLEHEECLEGGHGLVQVMVSRSYTVACTICDDMLCDENIVSCPDCEEIYHYRCCELWRRYWALENHPLHFNHGLYRTRWKPAGSSKCTACKLDIDNSKYVFSCSICSISFHFKCALAVGLTKKIKAHKHCAYNFGDDAEASSSSSRHCTVCNKPCGASYYGCDICNMSAHVECIGFPTYVKNQLHRHIVRLKKIDAKKICSICGLETKFPGHKYHYTCDRCKDAFHTNCILMSMVEHEAATEEEQVSDISNEATEEEQVDDLSNEEATEEEQVGDLSNEEATEEEQVGDLSNEEATEEEQVGDLSNEEATEEEQFKNRWNLSEDIYGL